MNPLLIMTLLTCLSILGCRNNTQLEPLKILGDLTGIPAGAWQTTPLTKGNSSATLKLATHKDKKYVIKEIHNDTTNTQRHITASTGNYGPKVYKVKQVNSTSIIIMEYLKPEKTPDNPYKKLATMLRKIHNGPNFKPGNPRWHRTLKHINNLKSKKQS